MTHLFDVPYAEARRLVATGAPVYLTVNPVEYHGPHLSLHNDRLLSLGMTERLHARLAARHPDWPLLIGADLEVGVEPCPGLGSRHTPFSVVRELVLEACHAVASLGAERVVLMTFHGAPLHNLALSDAVRALEARGVAAVAPFHVVLHEMLAIEPEQYAGAFAHVEDPGERAAMMAGLGRDFHAGFFETSMALHLAPDSVSPDYVTLPPCPDVAPVRSARVGARLAGMFGAKALARDLAYAADGFGWAALDPFPGYTGRPHRASAEAGRVFAEAILGRYEALVEDVFAGRRKQPEAFMPWVRWATLGGRVGGMTPA